MSLDGFVAGPDETGIDHIFEWYFSDSIDHGNPSVITGPAISRSGGDDHDPRWP
jgi:hypothetical protein